MNGFLESQAISGASWLGFGLNVFFKSLSILALTWMVTLALRNASASFRHWIWTLGFVGLLALPIASVTLPAWQITISTHLAPIPIAVDDIPPPLHRGEIAKPRWSAGESELPERSFAPGAIGNSSATSWPWKKVIFLTWLGVFAVLASRIVAGFVASRLLVKPASKVTHEKWVHLLDELSRRFSLRRYVQLLQTERSMVPITCGVFRPKILLPAGAEEWPEDRRRSVLLHELGHVRRHDCLIQWMTQFASAVYWWNPMVWFAARQLRQESERACDDLVLDAGTRASDYAHDLLEMARALNVTRRSPLASVTLAHRSRFEDRLLSILDSKATRHTLSRVNALASILTAGALLVPIAVLQPSTRAQASSPTPQAIAEDDVGTTSAEATSQTTDSDPPQSVEEQADEAVNERAIVALIEALRDPEPTVREQAVAILGRIGHGTAVPPLIESLHDEDDQVREGAAWALGVLEDDRATEPLIEALGDEADSVREQSAWALGMLRDSEAVETLGGALGDMESNVREQAAWALGMIQDGRSVPALMEALDDPEPNVREQVAWALGMIRDESAASGLAITLQDDDVDVREQAAWALGMIQAPASVAPLIEFLKDADPDVREQAAWALGMIRDERATTGLAETLQDEDADVREQVAWALGMIRSTAAVLPLIESLKDADPDVREQTAWALGMIQDERATDALYAAMKDDDPDVREQAIWALGMIVKGQ